MLASASRRVVRWSVLASSAALLALAPAAAHADDFTSGTLDRACAVSSNFNWTGCSSLLPVGDAVNEDTSVDHYASLVHFDLGDAGLPEGAVITSAQLILYNDSIGGDPFSVGEHAVAQPVLVPWNDDVDWSTTDGSTPWSGSDFGDTVDNDSLDWGLYLQFDVTDVVQDWVDGTSDNDGIRVTAPESAFAPYLATGVGGFSKPELSIEYTTR